MVVGTSQTMHLSGIRVEAGGTFATTKGGVGLSPGGKLVPSPASPHPQSSPHRDKDRGTAPVDGVFSTL